MEAVGNLRTFASLAENCESEHNDVLFFRSVKDPTHIRIADISEHPTDWESVHFSEGVPDVEEALALPKGTYLILHSPGGNTSAFYRVRGNEGKQSDASAFKHSLTMLQEYRLELNKSQEATAKSEAVSAKLAERLDKSERKRKKIKKKLKKATDGTWERTIETVVETVMANHIVATIVGNVIANCVQQGGASASPTQNEVASDGFDYQQ